MTEKELPLSSIITPNFEMGGFSAGEIAVDEDSTLYSTHPQMLNTNRRVNMVDLALED